MHPERVSLFFASLCSSDISGNTFVPVDYSIWSTFSGRRAEGFAKRFAKRPSSGSHCGEALLLDLVYEKDCTLETMSFRPHVIIDDLLGNQHVAKLL